MFYIAIAVFLSPLIAIAVLLVLRWRLKPNEDAQAFDSAAATDETRRGLDSALNNLYVKFRDTNWWPGGR